jgi:hypothetical protein
MLVAKGIQIERKYLCIEDYKPEKNCLRIVYVNARSVRNKFDEIEEMLKGMQDTIHILVIAETWLNEGEESFYNIAGYQSTFASRVNGKGGGVAIYTHNTLNISILERNSNENSVLGLQVQSKHFKTLNIYALYRKPSSNVSDFLNNLETILCNSRQDTIIIGDFNIDIHKTSQTSKTYINTLKSYNYFICNTDIPTRTTETSVSLIDHIISNRKNTSSCISNVDHPLSDHNILILDHFNSMKLHPNNRLPLSQNNPKINNVMLKTYLENHTFPYDIGDSIDQNYNKFIEYLKKVMDSCTFKPKLKIGNRQQANTPWFDSKLDLLIKERNSIFKQWKRDPSDNSLATLKNQARNKVTNYRRLVKARYYTKIFNENVNNPRQTWKTINSILANAPQNKKTQVDCLLINNTETSDPKHICTEFNNFFISVGSNLANTIPSYSDDTDTIYTVPKATHSFFMHRTNKSEILRIISDLKKRSSPGLDGITPAILQICRDQLVDHLVLLVNESLSTGIFPDQLKIAKIVPVYKSECKKNVSNYRPISVLSVFSKIFEQVIKYRFTKYLTQNNLLASQQYGFRKGSNTKCAAFDFISNIQKYLDDGEYATGIFIDLKKAFDTVDHNILLSKLEYLGVVGTPLKLFCSYLTNRNCLVQIGENFSEFGKISCGVPQGSILGPLLFLVYINDVTKWGIQGTLQLYADDTIIFYHGRSLKELEGVMQSDLSHLANWLRVNKLSLNLKKTSYMLFGSKKHVCLNISLGNSLIEKTNVTKYLGLLIDSNLSWSHQFDLVKSKVAPVTGVLYRLRSLLPKPTLLSIYYAMIHSHLVYLSCVWGFATKKQISEIQVLQNRALRNILGLPWDTHIRDIYRQTEILPFKVIPIHEIANAILNILNFSAHSNLKHNFYSATHTHYTRNSKNLLIPKFRSTKFGTKSLMNISRSLYNELPKKIKELKTPKLANKALKDLYLKKFLENGSG